MGDFCVSGFHSHLPIHYKNKAVAIICKVNTENTISSVPCYLTGVLSPIAMPIIGEMGDYGTLDNWEESETTRLLKSLTNMDLKSVFNDIVSCSEYVKPEEYPEVFKKLDKCNSYHDSYKQYRYVIIYEHYSVYKSMTYDMNDCRDYLNNIINFIKTFYKVYPDFSTEENINIFDNFNIFIFTFINHHMNINMKLKFEDMSKEKQELSEIISKLFKFRDFYILGYIHLKDFMGLYYTDKYDLENMIDDIVDWVSFVNTLNYIGGNFYLSNYANQDWHHDKKYCKLRRKILKSMLSVVSNLDS